MRRLLKIGLVLAALGLAGFLTFGPGIVERSKNKVTQHAPYPVSEAVRALHATLTIGDWHGDSLLWNRDLLARASYGHIDFPRLREGNVAVQVFTTVTSAPSGINVTKNKAGARDNVTPLAMAQLWPPRTWTSLLQRGLYQAQKLQGFAAREPHSLRILRSRADLAAVLAERAAGSKVVGALLGAEGAHVLEGDLANIDVMYDAGFRLIGLHHFLDSELGGSLHGESGAGLTDFGRAVVTALADRHIIIDLTHTSAASARDVLVTTAVPVIISHTGIFSHCETQRNFPDDIMQAVAARGGVIGIGYWHEVTCDATPAGIAASVRAAVDLLGVDHVSLGSDFDGAVEEPFDTSELVAVTDALLTAGFSAQDVAKVMGGNMVRFVAQALPET